MLSSLVDGALRPSSAVAPWLAAILTLHLAVHYAGLRSAFGILGKLHRAARETTGLRLTHQIDVIGEVQPIGFFEDFLAIAVTVLFVLLLTSAVRELRARRAQNGDDGLPRRLWVVALLALRRPRRVVRAIWRSSGASNQRIRGFAGIDILWPIWLATNVAVKAGDHLSAGSRTIRELRSGTWLETVAEVGFLATGGLLLMLTAAVVIRLRTGDETRHWAFAPRAQAAGLVAALLVSPVAAVDMKRAYAASAAGPSISELQDRITVDRLWQERERAAATADEEGLRSVEGGELLATDLVGLRSQGHARWQRDMAGVRPLRDPRDPNRILAIVDTFGAPGWHNPTAGRASELLTVVRVGSPRTWRFALEVPFWNWPWPWADMQTEPGRPAMTEPEATTLVRSALGKRVPVRDAFGLQLVRGREIACGAGIDRQVVVQVCTAQAFGSKPIILGRLTTRR